MKYDEMLQKEGIETIARIIGCTEISLKPLDQNAHLIISYYDDDK